MLFAILFGYNNLGYAQPVVYSSPGTYTFIVPAGVTTISIECWGGGAGGHNGNNRGGGGGAYAGNLTYSVTPGATYTVTVGAGATSGTGSNGENSSFGSVVIAVGGGKGADNGAGGLATDCTGAIRYSGGDGGTSTGNGGAGGGGSAGAGGNGGNGGNTSNNSGGIGGSAGAAGLGTAGASGGGGGSRYNDGNNGSLPGGGGGERGENASSSGGGGNGEVIVSWPSYCTPSYSTGTSDGDYISLVQLGTINNSTGRLLSPFYNYYSSLSTDLSVGNSYTITLSAGSWGSGNNISVWIDFNQNMVFEASEKLGNVLLGAMPATGTINFTVPSGATLGTTRMRVREVWSNSSIDPCNSETYGETEDYNVKIVSGAPTIISFTPTNACEGSGSSVVITGTNFTGATNVSFNGIAATYVVNSATQITATLPATATTGKISVTTPGGTANSVADFTVNTSSTAPTSITGNTTICNGSSTTLSVSGGLLGTGASWKWYSGSCGGTLAGTGSSINISPTVNTTYYVRAEGTCNTTICISTTVTVTSPPVIVLNSTNETCPASNDGTISPTISGGLSNIRYVKLTQQNSDWSNLAEIEAREIFTGTNVALSSNGASATCSSVYSGNIPTYGPANINDGVTVGYNMWHSGINNIGEWVRIDLGSAKNIDFLRIHNRNDCCWNRAQDFLVELFDASNNLVFSKHVNIYENVDAPHYIDVNVLDISWTDAATTLNRTGLDAGTYTFNYADAVGCSSNTPKIIGTTNTESTTPTAITGTATICNGSSTTLTVSGGSLGTGASWKWYSGSCGGTLVGTGSSINVSPTVNTTYYVRAEGTCNNTLCFSRLVTVNALPSVTAPASVCVGGTITLSPTTGGTWTSSNTGRATVTNAGVVTGVAAGSVNFTFTSSTTGCSATTTNVTVLSLTTTPVITTTPLCAGNTTISGTSESGATIYIYSGAMQIGTATASGTNWTVTVSPAFVTGAVITAKAQASGKCLSNASASITVIPTPLTGSLYRRPNT